MKVHVHVCSLSCIIVLSSSWIVNRIEPVFLDLFERPPLRAREVTRSLKRSTSQPSTSSLLGLAPRLHAHRLIDFTLVHSRPRPLNHSARPSLASSARSLGVQGSPLDPTRPECPLARCTTRGSCPISSRRRRMLKLRTFCPSAPLQLEEPASAHLRTEA